MTRTPALTERDIANAIADTMGADRNDPRIIGDHAHPVSAVDEFMWWWTGDDPTLLANLKTGQIDADDIAAAARWAAGRKLI